MSGSVLEQGEAPVLIGGKWTAPAVQTYTDVHNPSTGETISRTPMCAAAEVDAAVQAARAAFKKWADTPAPRRAGMFFKYLAIGGTQLCSRARQNGILQIQTVGRAIVHLIVPDEVEVVLFGNVIVDPRGLELAVVDSLCPPGEVVAVVIAIRRNAADQSAAADELLNQRIGLRQGWIADGGEGAGSGRQGRILLRGQRVQIDGLHCPAGAVREDTAGGGGREPGSGFGERLRQGEKIQRF